MTSVPLTAFRYCNSRVLKFSKDGRLLGKFGMDVVGVGTYFNSMHRETRNRHQTVVTASRGPVSVRGPTWETVRQNQRT